LANIEAGELNQLLKRVFHREKPLKMFEVYGSDTEAKLRLLIPKSRTQYSCAKGKIAG